MPFTEPKSTLSQLIEQALKGEENIIARGKVPAVRLVPRSVPAARRQFGAMKGRARTAKAFFEPLTSAELRQWYGEG